jgi:hypothetical protein
MTTVSYREAWGKEMEKDHSDYEEILRWDRYKNWEINRSPEGTAKDELLDGVSILFGNGPPALAKAFLERSLHIAERIVKENRLQSPLCISTFPENRGVLLRSMAYARLMLGGRLDELMVLQASADFEQWCEPRMKKSKWHDLEETEYLVAVRQALIGGDEARARSLLEKRRSFRWHAVQAALLKGLSAGAGVPLTGAPLQERFEDFFDVVRDPHFKPEVYSEPAVLRLDMGLLHDKYFISPDGKIDWPRTVAAISR